MTEGPPRTRPQAVAELLGVALVVTGIAAHVVTVAGFVLSLLARQ
jgi:hypothetical protein